ncbi:Scaffold-type E3 ligase [Lambiella insularis]|nr:Scaffold-type E3 ligase [Lambiella insularis]
MPPAYTPSQKSAIAQFVSFTSVKESVAAKQLKAQGWNVEQAVDAYFSTVVLETILGMLKNDVDYGKGEIYNARARLEKKLCLLPMHEHGPSRIHGLGPPMLSMLDVDEENRCRALLANHRPSDPDFLTSKYDGIAPDKTDFHASSSSTKNLPTQYFRRQFIGWIDKVEDEEHWLTSEALPPLFRLALRRPLMSKQGLRTVLKKLKVAIYLPKSFLASTNWNVESESEDHSEIQAESHELPPIWTAEPDPVARRKARDIMRGLEPLSAETSHVSYRYKHIIPAGNNFANKHAIKWADEALEPDKSEMPFEKFFEGTLDEEERDVIEDMSYSIILFRSGTYTLDMTLDALHDRLIGLVYDLSKRIPDIENRKIDAEKLAKRIYMEAVDEDSDETDEDDLPKDRWKSTKSVIGAGAKPAEAKKPKVLIKFKFDIGSRVQRIYQDVLSGELPLHEAPTTFRLAIQKPDILDEELARLLHEHNVPPDLFFGSNVAVADVPMLDKPYECDMPVADKASTQDASTTKDCRRTSELATANFQPSVPGVTPITLTHPGDPNPPAIGVPKLNLLGKNSAIDETWRLSSSNLQQTADTVPYDCLCIDDLSDEAGVPNAFYEEPPENPIIETIEDGEVRPLTSKASKMSVGSSSGVKKLEHGANNALLLKGLSSVNTHHLPVISIALRPVTCSHESLNPKWLVPGTSVRTRVRLQSNDNWIQDNYNPDFRNGKEDWEDHASEVGQLSSSSEDGETKCLWGLWMPTRKARELGMKLGLASSYVRERFRSSTRKRDDAKTRLLETTRKLIPYLKRKASSASSGSPKRKSPKFDEDLIAFAEPGDDHKTFLDKRIYSQLLYPQAAPQERCFRCSMLSCTCLSTVEVESRALAADKVSSPSRNQPPSDLQECSSPVADVPTRAVDHAFHLTYGSYANYSPPMANPQAGTGHGDIDDMCPPLIRFSANSPSNPVACVWGREDRSTAELEHLLVTKLREDKEGAEKKSTSDEEHTADIAKWNSSKKTTQLKLESCAKLPQFEESSSSVVEGFESTPAVKNGDLVQQPVTNYQRNGFLSIVLQPLHISGPQEVSTNPSKPITENEIRPVCVARKSSVITTMKSLKIDDEEIAAPISPSRLPAEQGNAGDMLLYPSDTVVEQIQQPFESDTLCSTVDNEPPLYETSHKEILICPPSPRPPPAPIPRHAMLASLDSQSYYAPLLTVASPLAAKALQTRIVRGKAGCAPTRPPTPAPKVLGRKEDFESTSFPSPNPTLATLNGADDLAIASMKSIACSKPSNSPVSNATLLGHFQGSEDESGVMDFQVSCPSLSSGSSASSPESVVWPEAEPWSHKPVCTKAELLAKIDHFLEDIASRRKLFPQAKPQVRRATRDLEEEAWANKCSHRVYLWKRREIKHRTNQEYRARYFQNSSAPPGKAGNTTSLNKLFDKYRGPYPPSLHDPNSQPLDDPENPDAIGTSGTMKYLNDLTINLDEPAVLAVLTEVSAPTMGELSRDGFVAGWKALNAESLSKQQSSLAHIRNQLTSNTDYFRRVYKHSFLLARSPGQKAVALDTAIDFWRLLFGKGGIEWRTAETGGMPKTDWLGLWCVYLEEGWKKSVSKDMWDQTGVFALKSLEDASMSWWSEDGAWPGVLDEFVGYVKERTGIGKTEEGDGMDIE